MTQRIHLRAFRIAPWQFWLIGAFGFALTVALLVVAAGVFLIMAPLALAAGAYYRLRGGWAAKPNDTGVIEADYKVINEPQKQTPAKR